MEVLGLDGKCLLDAEVIAGVIHLEVKVLQQNRNHKESLLPCERPSNTAAHAVSKWLPCVLGQLVEVLIEHPLRLELLGVGAVDLRVAMHFGKHDGDNLVLIKYIFATSKCNRIFVVLLGVGV